MSNNSKYNCYPNIIIDNNYQVHGVGSDQSTTNLSDKNFAFAIGISEDGTLWAISTTPDPDGGGSKIFWSDVGAQWNEINTPDPGGIAISGGPGSSCFFLTTSGEIWTMDTNGTGKEVYSANYVLEMDAGGGYIWALMAINGGIPSLHYSTWNAPFDFKKFNLGENASPFSLSVNYQGNCYATENYSPVYYSNDGSSSGSAGSGLDGAALKISFKNVLVFCFF